MVNIARRPSWRRAFLLFAIALLVKGAVLVALHDHPLLQPRGALDPAVYVDLARGEVPPVPYFVSPLYLYFLRLVFLAGGGLLAAKVLQIVLGAIAVVLVSECALALRNERAGWVAGGLMILTGVLTFYEVTILQTALDPFLTALALFALQRSRGPWSLASAGAATALFVLNRPNALLWLGFATLVLLWKHRVRTLAFIAGALLVIAPVAIRNYTVAGEFVAISSHGGLNFYIGNHDRADGTYRSVPGIRPDIRGQQVDAQRLAERAAGRELTTGEASRWFYSRALAWMREDPAGAAALFLRKLVYTFNQREIALNYSYPFFAYDVRSPLTVLIVGPWLLFPLAAAAYPRGKWPFAAFLLVYAVSVALFFVSSRYRVPLLVAAAILAPQVARPFARSAVIALGALVLVCWPLKVDDGRTREAADLVFYDIEQGRTAEARALLAKIEGKHPDPAMLYYRAGLAFRNANQPADAAAMFEAARTAPAQAPETQLAAAVALSEVRLAEGRTEEALGIARSLDPARFDARHAATLGRLALAAKDAALARVYLGRAVQLEPRMGILRHELGLALIMGGRHDEALKELEQARALEPSNPATHLNLAVLYAEKGDRARARASAAEALRLRPGYEQAQGLLDALR